MLVYFTQLFQRNIIMTFYSRNIILLIHDIKNYSRPFDEILYSSDSSTTTNNNGPCLGSSTTKDTFTWTNNIELIIMVNRSIIYTYSIIWYSSASYHGVFASITQSSLRQIIGSNQIQFRYRHFLLFYWLKRNFYCKRKKETVVL